MLFKFSDLGLDQDGIDSSSNLSKTYSCMFRTKFIGHYISFREFSTCERL